MPPRGPESRGWKGLWLLSQQMEEWDEEDAGRGRKLTLERKLSLEDGAWKEQTREDTPRRGSVLDLT